MNAYLLGVDLSSMGFVLLFFALAVQLTILFRLMWQAIGISSSWDTSTFPLINSANRVFNVELVNTYNDRYQSSILFSNSLVDAMASGISIVIAIMTVIGRAGPLELFFLTLFGTFLGELNSQLFWRLFITDCGYGMRTFLYGGALGLVSSIVLWRRKTTLDHEGYCTNYFSQTYSLLGTIFSWILFPALIIADLYHVNSTVFDADAFITSTDNIMIGPAVLNVIFAMVSSVIGAFSASILVSEDGRIAVHEIVFASLSVKILLI
jgi:hypothetical protein